MRGQSDRRGHVGRPQEEGDGDPRAGRLLHDRDAMHMVLVPGGVEVHGVAAVQPLPLALPLAALAAGGDGGLLVRRRLRQADPARTQRVADGAHALAEGASAVGARALLPRVDVSVIVVEGAAVRVEVDLHGCHEAAAQLLAVPHEPQQQLRAALPACALQHAREGGHRLVPAEGTEDELAAGLPDGALLDCQRAVQELLEEHLIASFLAQDALNRAARDRELLGKAVVRVARAILRQGAKLALVRRSVPLRDLGPLHLIPQGLLVAALVHVPAPLLQNPQALLAALDQLHLDAGRLGLGDLRVQRVVVLAALRFAQRLQLQAALVLLRRRGAQAHRQQRAGDLQVSGEALRRLLRGAVAPVPGLRMQRGVAPAPRQGHVGDAALGVMSHRKRNRLEGVD
mmetsp:Transcript_70515/g.181731  ORF Transcript_70515/g.181731 Transcript_70515/m.181731 type:complete len:400 (-) Transcript_70515:473-1672(-)